MLGRIEPGGAYRRENFNVVADRPAHDALAEALADVELSAGHRPGPHRPSTTRYPSPSARRRAGRCRRGRSSIDPTSTTGFSRDGREHPCASKNRHQLRLLVTMRDRVLEYLDAPTDAGRSELADLYAAYRDVYERPLNAYDLVEVKPVRRRGDDDDDDAIDDATGERTQVRRRYPKLEGFRTDPSWWSVAALEVFDDDTGEATPAPILQRPIIEAARRGVAGSGRHDRAGRGQLARPLAPHRPRLRRRPARRRRSGRRGAAGRGGVPDAGRGVGPRRPLPRR